MHREIVYIFDEGCFGVLKQQHAFFSVVLYAKDGIEYEVELSNDDFELWESSDSD